jgi:hypothetical protein
MKTIIYLIRYYAKYIVCIVLILSVIYSLMQPVAVLSKVDEKLLARTFDVVQLALML